MTAFEYPYHKRICISLPLEQYLTIEKIKRNRSRSKVISELIQESMNDIKIVQKVSKKEIHDD